MFIKKLICKTFELFLRTLNKIWSGFLKSDLERLLVALHKDGFSRIEAPLFSDHAPIHTKLLVVVPFKDRADLTMECFAGLFSQRLKPHQSMQLLLIDHESKEVETSQFVHSLMVGPGLSSFCEISRLDYEGEFNFSRMMNLGVSIAQQSGADLLLFLNNDIEFTNDLTVSRMIDILHCSHKSDSTSKVGIVGLDLVYPDNTIQHVCAWPGAKIIATHPLKGCTQQSIAQWRNRPYRSVPAVTGAALMCRTKEFEEWGRFDEALPVLAQDIDLCLKAREKGFSVVALTDSNTIHKEGRTKRDRGFCFEQLKRFYSRWADKPVFLKTAKGALSSWSEVPTHRLSFEPAYPWRWFALKR